MLGKDKFGKELPHWERQSDDAGRFHQVTYEETGPESDTGYRVQAEFGDVTVDQLLGMGVTQEMADAVNMRSPGFPHWLVVLFVDEKPVFIKGMANPDNGNTGTFMRMYSPREMLDSMLADWGRSNMASHSQG